MYDADLGPEPTAAESAEPGPADPATPHAVAAGPRHAHAPREYTGADRSGPDRPRLDRPGPDRPGAERPGSDADTEPPPVLDGPPDGELADRVRAGDGDAYGLLYERHVHSVRRFARTCTRTPEAADDLCAEAFARTLQALRSGQGPREAFRAYLLTTVRHVAGDWTRSDRREWLTEDFTVFESAWEKQDRVVRADDARLALQAFQDLPERSRVVLWHVDIEGEQAVQVAPLVGENPDNVRKILERARQELRDNYFVAFATGGVKDENCKKFTRHYGRHIRNRMDSEKRRERIDAHLRKCSRCNDTYAEMVDVRDRYGPIALALIGITAPIFLGGTAAAADTAAAATAVAGGMGLAVGAAGGGGVASGVAAGAAAAGGAAAGGAAAGGAAAGGAAAGAGVGSATPGAQGASQAGRTAGRSSLIAGGVVVAVAVAAFALVDTDKPKPKRQAPPVAASAPAPLPPEPPPAEPPKAETRTPQPPSPKPSEAKPPPPTRAPLANRPSASRHAPRPTKYSPKPTPTKTRPTPPGATLVADNKEFRADDDKVGFRCDNGDGKWCENPTITVPEALATPLMPTGSTARCTEIKGKNGSHYTLCRR
ncbi:sigma-70 family RNA polymerase sigma factor [Embleya sp. NBC_00896]|uniref:RNA polymerase sigma factor n=1 Tax=Embleya sp. NBC_00896 TaxID=2975961 RepID=UPI0038648C06|nr:sigma-70 family RNA polymerase sigma factor [Embleya sp. NBC_00896]